jgi:hypothetical protein
MIAVGDAYLTAPGGRRLGEAPASYTEQQRERFDEKYQDLRALNLSASASDNAAQNFALGIDVIASTRRSRVDAPNPGDVIVHRGDELTVELIAWLWKHFLARGKLHLLAGLAGCNKTTLALAFIATLSRGGRWPDGTWAPICDSVIWSGEDGVQDTLLPRLIAHDADLERVHFVTRTVGVDSKLRAFDPAVDMAQLTNTVLRLPDPGLILVDPVVLTVSGKANDNGDVRRGLAPLVELAERTKAAALGITHFTKGTAGRNPVERVTGSLGFGAAARVVLAASKVPDDQGGGRIVVRAKNNIGPDGDGFRFSIRQVEAAGVETIRLEWGDTLQGSAHELLSMIEQAPEEREGQTDAEVYLREILTDSGGSMNRKDVLVAAKRAGYPERTIEHARARLRIDVKTRGFGKDRHSLWSLPSITARTPPHQNDCSNGSNDDEPPIAAIPAIEKGYARSGSYGDDDVDAYRRATRGE